MAIFDDLEAEQDRLEDILAGLDEAQWAAASGAKGWTVSDVVLHLAQSEEAVLASTAGASWELRLASGTNLDQVMDQLVQAERTEPALIFQRWRAARRGAVRALRDADPGQPLSWVAARLKPATLATTRLAEHWAHGLDITGPLGIAFPDTDRLHHVAWLAHRSLTYAFALAGEQAHEVRCDVTAPDGAVTWHFGPAGADSVISGPAGVFCRVAAQRLAPAESGLRATGPYGPAALGVLRTYAA
jgi:uncharacterized protein (TIGR03084 family)